MTHRDLDALVAQARGWTKVDEGEFWKGWGTPPNTNYKEQYPNVSTDIAEAMGLLEDWPGNYETERQGGYYGVTLDRQFIATATTLQEAICLAYLKAKGKGVMTGYDDTLTDPADKEVRE